MQVRPAIVEDAAEACNVLRRSITELCRLDHHDDPSILEEWLSNKTPDHVRSWIAHPDNCTAVAIEDEVIIGFGAMTRSGEITLNYVSPDARFRGVSKAILGWLEARARRLGNARCTLRSTETAHRFYLSSGYVRQGPPTIGHAAGYPMEKPLDVTA